MDDAEAEAVLLALGPKLTWQEEPRKGREPDLFAVPNRDHSYMVQRTRKWWSPLRVMYKAQFIESADCSEQCCPKAFSLQAAAKAACERHFATGKWE